MLVVSFPTIVELCTPLLKVSLVEEDVLVTLFMNVSMVEYCSPMLSAESLKRP